MGKRKIVAGTAIEPEIIEFGPHRVIGLRYAGSNANGEVAELWEGLDGLVSQVGEGQDSPDDDIFFGLCRCLPDATDGSFEYIAAIPAQPGDTVPDGAVEAGIPACAYAAFPVASLNQLMLVWATVGAWLTAHPEWKGYCDSASDGTCDCANHPSFEFYPPEFTEDGKLFIYVPVRPES